jgi:hypothetical protein
MLTSFLIMGIQMGEISKLGVSPHLRTETDPVSETSCLFFFFLVTIKIRTMDKVQNNQLYLTPSPGCGSQWTTGCNGRNSHELQTWQAPWLWPSRKMSVPITCQHQRVWVSVPTSRFFLALRWIILWTYITWGLAAQTSLPERIPIIIWMLS